ncbi:MAG: hypothetical protein M3N17_02540 [Actinomycetota bacterium]|nr:hypothetical protein [Actinomycetota bacterium]
MPGPERPGASAPGPPRDVELHLARSAVVLATLLAPPVVGVAALAAGGGGALGAAIGAAVVAGMFVMSGATLSWAARLGPTALMGAALGGYLLRLMIYALLIVLLRPVEAIHGPSLAVSAAVLLVAALVWEVRVVSRLPGAFWVRTEARRGRDDRPGVVQSRPSRAAGSPAPTTGDRTERMQA